MTERMGLATVWNLLDLEWWFSYALEAYRQDPGHVLVELLCLVLILYLLKSKSYDPGTKLSRKEKDQIIREWKPEPLCPPVQSHYGHDDAPLVVDGSVGATLTSRGRTLLNFASTNFLGIADSKELKDAAKQTITKYGVGSCGPRGFYGTIDVHLGLENSISQFLGVSEAILYSDSIACASSVIPAFAKRGDLILADEGVNFNIQQGILLSRSTVKYFKHNDMDDLLRLLEEVKDKDMGCPGDPSAQRRRRRTLNRRFIVCEGIYRDHGTVANIRRLVALKEQYKWRLILDDSYGFGVLGDTGRGSPEHWGIAIKDIDIMCSALDTACATLGGFCVGGTPQVVDHQRLSGAGYCFSASSPPYSAVVGSLSLKILSERPEMCAAVRRNAALLRKQLSNLRGVELEGAEFSPVLHLRLDPSGELSTGSRDKDAAMLQRLRRKLMDDGVVTVVPEYCHSQLHVPPPSLRVMVSAAHSPEQLDTAARLIKNAFQSARDWRARQILGSRADALGVYVPGSVTIPGEDENLLLA